MLQRIEMVTNDLAVCFSGEEEVVKQHNRLIRELSYLYEDVQKAESALAQQAGELELLRTENDTFRNPKGHNWDDCDIKNCPLCRADLEDACTERDRLREALQGIIDVGKRDMSNPKYDGYFKSARGRTRSRWDSGGREEKAYDSIHY